MAVAELVPTVPVVERSVVGVGEQFVAAPDLGASSRYVAPRDFIWNDTDPVDLAGHGTHVAGSIGQLTNNGVGVAGVAFNVRWTSGENAGTTQRVDCSRIWVVVD